MANLGVVYLPPVSGLPAFEERHKERLRRECGAFDWRFCDSKDEVPPLLPEARVLLVWGFSSEWNDCTPNLRLVATPAAGREAIRARPRPGLEIRFGTFHGELMAESLIGMMLAFTRGIKDCCDRRYAGWPRAEVAAGMRPLRGSHVVILGFGHIGKWAGRLAKPFGVRLTGVNRSDMTRPEYFSDDDRVLPLAGLDSILPEADHLVLVLPGSPETTNIIDARRLALLPAEAYLYNIGRGNAVDLPALAAALASGKLAGAGLDVFPEEPLPDDAPIRRAPRTMILPHITALGPNYLDLYLNELPPALAAAAED